MSIADVDITVARQWGFADTETERLSGEREPFPADFDEDIEPGWEIFALSFRRSERTFRGLPPVLVGRTVHFLHKPKKRRGVFVREGGCVRLAFVDLPGELLGSPVRVLHLRRWLLLLPLLLAALLLLLSLSLCSPSGSPDYLSGMTRTPAAVQKPVISVDYASFDATVDSVWVADSMTQDFTLSLPATCQYAKGKTGGNPIISSPSIMVDLNHDGKYDFDTECVYNAPDKTGYGAFIRPGCEVNRIKLTQSVPAGTYSARTVWRSVLASDGKTPASSTSFDFNLTVE